MVDYHWVELKKAHILSRRLHVYLSGEYLDRFTALEKQTGASAYYLVKSAIIEYLYKHEQNNKIDAYIRSCIDNDSN